MGKKQPRPRVAKPQLVVTGDVRLPIEILPWELELVAATLNEFAEHAARDDSSAARKEVGHDAR